MFEVLIKYLTSGGFDVYMIGKAPATCTKPFLVVMEGNEVETISTINKRLYEVWLYYPLGYYSKARQELLKLNNIMRDMKGLRKAYEDLPFGIDSEKGAYVAKLTFYMNTFRR